MITLILSTSGGYPRYWNREERRKYETPYRINDPARCSEIERPEVDG
jgi:hypothetical protein